MEHRTLKEIVSRELEKIESRKYDAWSTFYRTNKFSRVVTAIGYAFERHGEQYARFPLNYLEFVFGAYLETLGTFSSYRLIRREFS